MFVKIFDSIIYLDKIFSHLHPLMIFYYLKLFLENFGRSVVAQLDKVCFCVSIFIRKVIVKLCLGVEGARLESVYTVKGIKGSNPFLSANV